MASYIEGVIRKAAEADERVAREQQQQEQHAPMTSRVEAVVHKPLEPPSLGKNSRYSTYWDHVKWKEERWFVECDRLSTLK